MPHKDPEARRAYEAKRYLEHPGRKEATLERNKKYQKTDAGKSQKASWGRNNRDKRRAHSAVASALRSGKLTKPEICDRCPNSAGRPIEAHHEDYSKPLEVTWLCTKCHGLTRMKTVTPPTPPEEDLPF